MASSNVLGGQIWEVGSDPQTHKEDIGKRWPPTRHRGRG